MSKRYDEFDVTGGVLVESTAITFAVFMIYVVFAIPDNEVWLRAAVAIGYTIVAQSIAAAAVFALRGATHVGYAAARRTLDPVNRLALLRRAAFLSTYGTLVFVYVKLSGAIA